VEPTRPSTTTRNGASKRLPSGTRPDAVAKPSALNAAERARQRELLTALRAAERGNFTVRLDADEGTRLTRDIAMAFNRLVDRNQTLASEIVRVERIVGREGQMAERVFLGAGVTGGWATSVRSINALIGDLRSKANP
jgi:hypothetical protein